MRAHLITYERIAYREGRGVPARHRISLFAGTLGFGVIMLISLGPVAFVWWPQAVTITMVLAVVAVSLPMRTRVLIAARRLDVAFVVYGLPVHRLGVRMADNYECAIRIDQADHRSYMPWHRTSGCTAICFAGDGVSVLLRGYEGVLIGSADPRRLAAAINAARAEPAA